MDDSRNKAENGQQDVDEEVCAAAALKEDTERWEENGENDLDDVAERKLVSQVGRHHMAAASARW